MRSAALGTRASRIVGAMAARPPKSRTSGPTRWSWPRFASRPTNAGPVARATERGAGRHARLGRRSLRRGQRQGDRAGGRCAARSRRSSPADADDACEITPRSILEAMLFVGSPGNEPLVGQASGRLDARRAAGRDRRAGARAERDVSTAAIVPIRSWPKGPAIGCSSRESHAPARATSSTARHARPDCRRPRSKCWRRWPITRRSRPTRSAGCAARRAATS